MTSPKGVELFCGCGGLSTGFLDAGLHVVAGFDKDQPSVEAYNYNHSYRGCKGFVADLADISGNRLLEIAELEKIDFLLGGPPCQPFSIAGRQGGSGDSRAGLINDYLRLVSELQPIALVFENVPNLLKIESGGIFNSFRQGLESLGYKVSFDIRAASEFGVPQHRRRLLLVATLQKKIDLPPATHGTPDILNPDFLPLITAAEALQDLPIAADFEACGVYNHEPTEHTTAMLDRFADLKPGTREKKSFHDRLHPHRPSFTLRAGTGNFSPLRPVHYQYNRVVTVRESARLQSFNDDFIWPDWIPRLQQYRQVGNAVPPLVGKALAIQLATQLGWELFPDRFQGDPSQRPSAISMSDAEKQHRRRSRMRGASLGKERPSANAAPKP